MTTSAAAFALAAALHAGFQVTVTVLVYPALARVGTEHPDGWPDAHDRHSRAIVALVVLTYGTLLGSGGWLLSVDRSPVALLAVGAAGVAMGVTAAVAAPTHGRLGAPGSPDPALLRRLLRADRVRALAAVVSAGAAALLLLGAR